MRNAIGWSEPAQAALAFQHRRRWTWSRISRAALLSIAAVAAVGALPLSVLPQTKNLRQAPVQLSDATGDGASVGTALKSAMREVENLREKIGRGEVVDKFGDKAQKIMDGALKNTGGQCADLEVALDGVLHSLFLQQLMSLRQKVVAQHRQLTSFDTLQKASKEFTKTAEKLVRPGSSWSFETDRQALEGELEGQFRRDAALVEERARAARTQQATVDVIAKLQSQMEMLQQKAQAGRGGGGPMEFHCSTRVPNTPLQIVGKYREGRAHIELNLSPDKDPVNAEAGFVAGGPANVGMSFNLNV